MPTLGPSFRLRLPCLVGLDPSQSPAPNVLTDQRAAFWRNAPLRVEVGLLTVLQTVIENIAIIGALKLEVLPDQSDQSAPEMIQVLGPGDLNQSLAQEDWTDESDQHAVFAFPAEQVNLNLGGAPKAEFWLVVSYATEAAPDEWVPVYAGWVDCHEDGTPNASAGPLQGGSIVPVGATYDGSGHYTLAVTTGKTYRWSVKGANDTSITNGGQTITAEGALIAAEDDELTLNGTAGQPVTAVIRHQVYLTASEQDARFSRNLAIHSSAVAGSEVSGLTETEVATVTVPALGANDKLQFEAMFTRPTSPAQVENTLLNIEHEGNLIATHLLGGGPVIALPLQHLLQNRNATNVQLGGGSAAGALLTGAVQTNVATELVFKLANQHATDAITLQALTVIRIRPAS